jgi:hypothetical protein
MQTDRKQTQRELYEYWYKFLQLTDAKSWSQSVYNDFYPHHSKPFDEWWDALKEHFESSHSFEEDGNPIPDQVYVERITDLSDVVSGEIVVRVSTYDGNLTRTVEAFKRLLQATGSYSKTKPKFGNDKWGKYQLHKRPLTSSLDVFLAVHEAKKANPDIKLYDLAVQCGLITKAEQINDTDDVYTQKGKKLRAQTVASRALKYAKSIFEHVTQGRFPVY